jgi:hypothetical protein
MNAALAKQLCCHFLWHEGSHVCQQHADFAKGNLYNSIKPGLNHSFQDETKKMSSYVKQTDTAKYS